ncbi:MAG: serine protease [Actinobacteria bacterium]|nr:serine protease [Actinomycetota bacterium]
MNAPTTGSVRAVTPATVVTRQAEVTPTTAAAAQNLSAALAALWRTQSSPNLAFRIGGQVAVIENTRPRTISKGTGMVLTPDGLVLTNAHVVADPGMIVAVVGGTGPRYSARVVGTDPVNDVAVIRLVGASGLPVVTTGSASMIDLGAAVMAVGNAASGATALTATSGVVIDLNHTLRAADPGHPDELLSNLIAFVGPVEAGDSGGPLVDSAGDVVGMVTAGGLDAAGVMVGYAIPIDTALSIAHRLIG